LLGGAYVEGGIVPLTYNSKDAAQRIGVSRQWLREFLRQHPVDKVGIPFYVPVGSRKRFTERDLERILEANRESEREKLLSTQMTIHPSWVPSPPSAVPEESAVAERVTDLYERLGGFIDRTIKSRSGT
jgi:hypothetical protein